MGAAGRRLLSVSRTLHIYLTMLACLLLLFFGSTGFMLNHADWFG
ncbi:MAG TPA: PepSY-associated TM helix domain-containing protein, partial [Planctomycetota bacterium]|nr:PepSY-associated TM helix domain-containing protein [Planctomycetota bacterium]